MDDDFYRLCRDSAREADEAGGLYAIAFALVEVARQLKYLGNGDAATQMGAIENLAREVNEGMALLAAAIDRK